jgi:hypothetical protein
MPKQNSVSCDERRAHVRYSHALRTQCRPLGREGAASWTARVRDISRSGIALLMPREVRAGAVLVVALEGRGGRFARPILMRVVRVGPEGKGGWEVGCTFVTPLADDDLEALLLTRRPADSGLTPRPF